jgi:hypothetical protein
MSFADGGGGGGGGGGGSNGGSSSPRRGLAVPAVEHDPHADRIKFAHESVVEREDALLEESQRNLDVFLHWLQQHNANFPDLCVLCCPSDTTSRGERKWIGVVMGCTRVVLLLRVLQVLPVLLHLLLHRPLRLRERVPEWTNPRIDGLALRRYFKVYAPNVRGVHAAKPLPALHRFMEIPIKCLITDDLARSTPVGQRLKEIELQVGGQVSGRVSAMHACSWCTRPLFRLKPSSLPACTGHHHDGAR